MVKQLQTGSILVNFDGLKKRESINNRIDGFPEVQRYLRWPLTTVCNNTALTLNLCFVMVVPLSGGTLREVVAHRSLCSASPLPIV